MVTIKCSCHLQFSRIGSIGPFDDSSYWLSTETTSFHCRNHAYFCRVFSGAISCQWIEKLTGVTVLYLRLFPQFSKKAKVSSFWLTNTPSKFPPGLCWFVHLGPAVPYLCWPLCICEQYLYGNGASLLLPNLSSALIPTMSMSVHGWKCEGAELMAGLEQLLFFWFIG